MKLSFFLLLTIISRIVIAQDKITATTTESGEQITKIFRESLSKSGIRTRVSYYKGTPFLYPNYENGSFTITGGQTYNCPIMFNLLTNELLARIADTTIVLQNTNFTLLGNRFIVANGYCYQMLFKKNIALLKKQDIYIQHWFGNGSFDGEIMKVEKYYIQRQNKKMMPIELKKTAIRRILSLPKEDSLLITLPNSFDEKIFVDFLQAYDAKLDTKP